MCAQFRRMSVQPSKLRVIGYMTLNFVSSVCIIWVNKITMNRGFKWTVTLTALHFLYTFLGLELCARQGMFEKKKLSIRSVVPISAAFCGFVVFNNLSLQYNAVGTYQLMKVLTTPVVVALQFFLYSMNTPFMQMLSLVPVIVGVTLATVSHVETNFAGTVFGILGIVSTSMYQIWVKTQQEALKCSPQQLLYYQAPVSGAMIVLIIPFCENIFGKDGLLALKWSWPLFVWVNISAFLAFLVNLSIFLVIGKTSPVTYNVLGHGKLCVILASGYVLFREPFNFRNILGVLLTVAGIIWYTHLKSLPQQARRPAAGSSDVKKEK